MAAVIQTYYVVQKTLAKPILPDIFNQLINLVFFSRANCHTSPPRLQLLIFLFTLKCLRPHLCNGHILYAEHSSSVNTIILGVLTPAQYSDCIFVRITVKMLRVRLISLNYSVTIIIIKNIFWWRLHIGVFLVETQVK